MGSKKRCDHKLNDDHKSEKTSLKAVFDDSYISIIEQLSSIIAMSNISSFENSHEEYLCQTNITSILLAFSHV